MSTDDMITPIYNMSFKGIGGKANQGKPVAGRAKNAKYVTQYNKRDMMSAFEKIEICALSNR